MAYTRLTLEAFKAAYPAFSTLTQEPYDIWAGKAESRVGPAYGDSQQDATELLTAHFLAMQGIGMGASGTLTATGATSFKSGTFSASISDSIVSQRAKGGYGATFWGQEFAAIQKRLFGLPRLVGRIC